jgi:gliding motility-associated-like protein
MRRVWLLSLIIYGDALSQTVIHYEHQQADPHCLDSLYIADLFTTCGDAINDAWRIWFPCDPERFSITLYDRWGNIVFASRDHRFGWTGHNTDGEYLPGGLYVYVLDFTYLHESKQVKGHLWFLR